jgi:hypothetical protein
MANVPKQIIRAAIAVMLALATASCSTHNTIALRHDLSTRSVCCKSFSEMSFAPLTTEDVDLTIGSRSPLFDFEQGRSYFSAYSLPAGNVPGLIFRSYLLSGFLPATSVFMPSFIFLDKDKKAISAALDVSMQDGGTNFWLGPFFVGQMSVPSSAAYVIVFTTDTVHRPLQATSENGTVWPVPANLSGKMKIAVSR